MCSGGAGAASYLDTLKFPSLPFFPETEVPLAPVPSS